MGLSDFQVFDRDLSDQALADYRQTDALAVDTETMGLNPLRDRLCLVQLCDAQGHISVVRILPEQTVAPNLKQLLEQESIVKIFHFARFDITTLLHHLGIHVTPIFCTKIASKLARTYTSSHGLKEVVRELEQVELDKTAQTSDWGNALNLSDAQLQYAANDVRYLLNVRLKLIEMLKRENRWELAQQCFRCLPTFADLDLLQYSNIFEH